MCIYILNTRWFDKLRVSLNTTYDLLWKRVILYFTRHCYPCPNTKWRYIPSFLLRSYLNTIFINLCTCFSASDRLHSTIQYNRQWRVNEKQKKSSKTDKKDKKEKLILKGRKMQICISFNDRMCLCVVSKQKSYVKCTIKSNEQFSDKRKTTTTMPCVCTCVRWTIDSCKTE